MPLVEDAEYLPQRAVDDIQKAAWETQAATVAAGSAFYRALWDGVDPPRRLADLPSLPLCDKGMLRRSQAAAPPFGTYLAAAEDTVSRLHRTSGTTGQAVNLALSAKDAHVTAAVGGRCHRASGLGPGHRVVHCLNYRMWMGGLSDHLTLEATGATVVPFGVGESRLLIETIRALEITAISCTPSYPAVLEQVIAESFPAMTPGDLGLKLGLFGGEAGLDSPSLRARFRDVWGLEPRNANYGVSDVLSNFAGQCAHDTDLHFMAADVLYPELIEPETGEPLAIDKGVRGELVLTHLERECQPLVRFRTGDVIEVTGTTPCACGRTGFRFRVVGRSDDMVVVRGINVFPTMVAAVIHAQAALSGEYVIRLQGPGPYDRLPIEAEVADGVPDTSALAADIAAAVKSALGVTADVRLRPAGSMPRTAGKTRRVIRED